MRHALAVHRTLSIGRGHPAGAQTRRRKIISTDHPDSAQLGFDALIAEADSANARQRFHRNAAHLPSTLENAIPHFRLLIRQHHAAMLEADHDRVFALRGEARSLALKLNRGNPGILASADAPGRVLERISAAPEDVLPLWGQKAEFVIDVRGMTVRIAMEGVFGIGARTMFWPGFSAHAVEFNRPFLRETGYRSFLGIAAEPSPSILPQEFAEKVVSAYVQNQLKGKPVPIAARYRGDA